MDSTRISLARILDANVPLTWQDAVAVAQEVAMVSDVNAAMNSSPSLVTPEACFLTTDGEIDLPESAPEERPEAVATLLRAMLRGGDAPAALQSLARRRFADDLFGELSAFSTAPRRPIIAALATRALAPSPDVAERTGATAEFRPVASMPMALEPPRPVDQTAIPMAPALPPAAATPDLAAAATAPIELPAPWPAPRLVHAAADVVRATPAAIPPPFVASRAVAAASLAPPFRAADVATPATTEPTAAELELQRLRARSAERDPASAGWSSHLAGWLGWRPAFPDARVVGGTVIVAAAVVTVVWQTVPRSTPAPVSAPPAALVPDPAPVAATPSTDRAGEGAPPAPVPAPTATGRRPARAASSPPATSEVPRLTASGPPTTTTTALAGPRVPAAPAATAGSTSTGVAPPPVATGRSTGTAIVVPSPDTAPRAVPRSGREGSRQRVPVYTAQDTQVTPPVMLRQQLPSPLLEPGAEVRPTGPFLEILVDEQGAVEQVRLRARQPQPGQTWYRHRMLLAAAKAWQFEPALLEAQPVRYLMRVPLEP